MSDTLFKKVDYALSLLMDNIELGVIGLPDLQRPFVWKNALVRDLFDSMYRGYPVGFFLFWQNGLEEKQRQIGTENKQKPPSLLIVDGQQRLTSLYAVIKNIPVLRENYSVESIEIAFCPLTEKFEVADAAIRRDPEWIANISRVWAKNSDIFEMVDKFTQVLERARATVGESLVDEERKKIRSAIQRLYNIMSFPFAALELSATIDEEQVSNVFVRINSKGKTLNQADFILTLMSVFWDDGRKQLESFCRESRIPSQGRSSPFNYFIQPDPDQLLRVSVGLGFQRARLQFVYSILRGKDLETGEFSTERRDMQFETLKEAQAHVLNLQHWHDFMKVILQAGFRSGDMISSKNNLIFAYILFLLGKIKYKVDDYKLRKMIARWFFMTALTGRYSSSPETAMEFDLARFRDVKDGEAFLSILRKVCDDTFTEDYWRITLPNELATSSPRSPSLFAYYASLNLIGARVLFSKVKVAELLDPAVISPRSSIERHHLFPKDYLRSIGVVGTREHNQIANYALVEWGDNASIRGKAPEFYLPQLLSRLKPAEIAQMYYWHALPTDWEKMTYDVFLERRRHLIAKVVRDGYRHLIELKSKDESLKVRLSIQELLSQGESETVEFKSTLRYNLHTKSFDAKIEHSALKSIAAFLNTHGGVLVIGVSDKGEALGTSQDGFPDEDKMQLHLVNLIKDKIGAKSMLFVEQSMETFNEKRVLAVRCYPSTFPSYLNEGNIEHFYIRTGPATTQLNASEIYDYIKERFGD